MALLAGGLALVFGIGVMGLGWLVLRPATKTNKAVVAGAASDTANENPQTPGIAERIDNGVSAMSKPVAPKLPSGWSYNEPLLGFRAAWPVPPGSDGYTPRQSTFGNASHVSNMWAYKTGDFVYSITYSNMPAITAEDGVFIDGFLQRIYDNSARRAQAKGQTVPAFVPFTPMTWLGKTARQKLRTGTGRESGEERVIIFGTKVYIVSVMHPPDVPGDDPRVKTFFDGFWGE